MKITHVQSQVIRLPAVEALADGPVAHGASRDIVILTLGTDAGIEGIGLTYYGGFYGGPAIASLKAMVDQLASLVVGEDPLRIEAVTGVPIHVVSTSPDRDHTILLRNPFQA